MMWKGIAISGIATIAVFGIAVFSLSSSSNSSVDDAANPARTFAPDSPEAVVAAYASSATWQARFACVKQTSGIHQRMSRHYGNKPINFSFDRIVPVTAKDMSVGDVVGIDVVRTSKNALGNDVSTITCYYVERTTEGFAIPRVEKRVAK